MTAIRKDIDFSLRKEFLHRGQVVDRGEWQSMTDDRPQRRVLEIRDVSIEAYAGPDHKNWAEVCKPNLPWAEDHFQERVSGQPLNPGVQYQHWPWYEQGVEEHKPSGQFSHTYMERFWPKHAGEILGVRFTVGDLNDLLLLLTKRPMTRQAYIPIWFPEDIRASADGHRVPCSLGYHFMVVPDGTQRYLDCTYYLRSCDFYRYLWDDIYMAGRLTQWVADHLQGIEANMVRTKIANLHIFADEKPRMQSEYDTELTERMNRAGF